MQGNPIAITLRTRIKDAFERSELPSYSALSRAAGMSRPVAQKLLAGQFDNSKDGPGVFSVKRMANALGTTVGHLLGEDLSSDIISQSFFTGTNRKKSVIEKLMETYWRGAGRYEAFDPLIEDCDVYSIPNADDLAPQIVRVGKRTLFAGRLGGPFQRDAQREIDQFAAEKKQDVLEFFGRVLREKTAIGNAFLDHNMVTRPARVSASNVRLGLLTQTAQGQQQILLHTLPIPA